MSATRRQYLAGVAALAAARWNDAEYDIDAVDEWGPIKGGLYTTGVFSPESLLTSGNDPAADWLVEDDDLTDRTLEVTYDSEGVQLAIEGSAEDTRAGGLAEVSPEQAREIAAAIFQAAEELERREGDR
ncbi:hypothetical protein [Halorubrum sp. DTA98]|uniref:hypothetical protein n=1 Tax=Halorubrum sp. DTA98 TaxID=3402163 RepID=UPI003AAEDC58